MTDPVGSHDLRAIDGAHPEGESIERLLATTAAETTAGVTGVHHLGGTAARSLDRATRAVLGTTTSPGVSIARIDGALVLDLDLVSEYPRPVQEVIHDVREQVGRAAAQLTRENVVVNVNVTDVHGPFDPIEVPDSEREDGPSLVEKAGDAVDSAREKGAAALDSAREKGGAALDSAREKGGAALDSARERAADALDDADERLDEAADRAAAERAEAEERAEERDAAEARTDRETVVVTADAPAAEFVVRVEVEPVDAADVEPVETADVATDASDASRADDAERRGSE
ncbi:Asp23/Gls24 family envelope stress response protein [Rathayibacter sp. VKM Ac-2856]|uniref:Asp23/Gls24 family envelope stress response protein n=1 Tax=unclassified Rathayibacter TaxID=2609250 RepID=UPI001564D839|nr:MULTISPECIES: Asp23/Gls24 family envelope stress response protein [unclassified Rathayibacter]NQX05252.1 Asp23/Gls24 family envelope stress response protein [Rathayibacter sp. VKM Ac-2858]NQX20873.1 Asp23/Gls24 family envelope stress response protein [Rathayibacter sp. VKM Ac-2856]